MVYSLKPIYDLLLDANSKVKKYKLQAKHERQQHVICWSCHVSYVSMLLENNLTENKIACAQKMFVQFCNFYVQLFGEECCKFPNFHWASHIFSDCREWGYTRFFWALLYELKHKEFKQCNDRSNHKFTEWNGAEYEKLKRQLLIRYPWLRKESKKWFAPLTPGQYIIYRPSNNEPHMIGKV